MKKIEILFAPILFALSLSSCGRTTVFEPSFKQYGKEVDTNSYTSQLNLFSSNVLNAYFKNEGSYGYLFFYNLKNVEIDLRISNLCEKEAMINETGKLFYYSEKTSHLVFDSTNGRFKHNSFSKQYSDSDEPANYYAWRTEINVNKGKTMNTVEENYYGEIGLSTAYIADINRSIVHIYNISQSNIIPLSEYSSYISNSLSELTYRYDNISYFTGDTLITHISKRTADNYSEQRIIQVDYYNGLTFRFKYDIRDATYHVAQCYELSLKLYNGFVNQVDYANYQFVFNHINN